MVEEGPKGMKTRVIRTDYPVTEGLILGTTKLSEDAYLEPEQESLVLPRKKVGIS